LGLHYQYQNGKAACGNSIEGVMTVRCGSHDEVHNSDWVIFKTGRSGAVPSMFVKTWENQKYVRVLLGAGVPHPARKHMDTQYYLGNMYIHKIWLVDGFWSVLLRSNCIEITTTDYQNCNCCLKNEE
jgi:hypothetical protein